MDDFLSTSCQHPNSITATTELPASANHRGITKCIRNTDPKNIDIHGFVEISDALPRQLVADIKSQAMKDLCSLKKVSSISNALQVDVSAVLRAQVEKSVTCCDRVCETMAEVFGKTGPSGEQSNYVGFEVETPKVLAADPGADPQISHADDCFSSCMICLVHLSDGQEPTLVAKYEGLTIDYPTGIHVSCKSELDPILYLILFRTKVYDFKC